MRDKHIHNREHKHRKSDKRNYAAEYPSVKRHTVRINIVYHLIGVDKLIIVCVCRLIYEQRHNQTESVYKSPQYRVIEFYFIFACFQYRTSLNLCYIYHFEIVYSLVHSDTLYKSVRRIDRCKAGYRTLDRLTSYLNAVESRLSACFGG